MKIAIIVLLIGNLLLGLLSIVLAVRAKKGSGVTRREAENIVRGESDHQTREIYSAVNAANGALLNAIKVHTETQGASTDRFMAVIAGNMERQDKRQQEFIRNVEGRLDGMKEGLEKTLSEVRKENARRKAENKKSIELDKKISAAIRGCK